MELFDVGLQLCPDAQVSFHPVHLFFISEDTRRAEKEELKAEESGCGRFPCTPNNILREKVNSHILVLLEDPVGVKHGSISHFLHVRTRLWSLEQKEHVGTKEPNREPESPAAQGKPFPAGILTMATQPRAGMLSLTADK